MSSPIVIDFYYDIASPWAYYAFVILKRYESVWNFQLNLNPNLLGGIFKASGNKSPVTVKNKGEYIGKYDMIRTADYYGIKVISRQEGFPPDSRNLMRFLRVIKDKRPEILSDATQRIWQTGWGEGQIVQVTKPENFSHVLHGLVDESTVQEWINESNQKLYSDLLRSEAEALVANGCFGNPWLIVTRDGKSEPFFGSDRFAIIARILNKTYYGPFPPGSKAKI